MRRQHVLKQVFAVISGLALGLALPACARVNAHSQTPALPGWDSTGRLAVENEKLTAVFSRKDGALFVSMKAQAGNTKDMRIVPFSSADRRADKIVSCRKVKGEEGKNEVEASFSAGGKEMKAAFLFNEDGVIEIRPAENLKGISVSAAMEYAVLPSRIMDDVIYDPMKFPARSELRLPSEQIFMGLLEGKDGILVCAWPEGNQRIEVLSKEAQEGARRIQAIELGLDGKSAYLGALLAPGIWHAEELLPSYLEKDVGIDWKKPFPAKWKTQLVEENRVETAYPFGSKKRIFWRAGLGGDPVYPVWFQGDQAFFHLSKQFPPAGRVLIYALEGHKDTPVAFAAKCLGDIPSLRQKKELHFPPRIAGFDSCDGQDRMTRIFRMGLQAREKQYLREGLDDFLAVTNVELPRFAQYGNFIERMRVKLASWEEKANAEMRPFLDKMKDNLDNLNRTYGQYMEGRTPPEQLRYQNEVIAKLRALAAEKGLEAYPEAAFLIEENHHLVGVFEDELTSGCGGQAREWARQAACGCADNPAAVKYAEEIRKEIRELLGTDATDESVY